MAGPIRRCKWHVGAGVRQNLLVAGDGGIFARTRPTFSLGRNALDVMAVHRAVAGAGVGGRARNNPASVGDEAVWGRVSAACDHGTKPGQKCLAYNDLCLVG
jgi:hypothetical protein